MAKKKVRNKTIKKNTIPIKITGSINKKHQKNSLPDQSKKKRKTRPGKKVSKSNTGLSNIDPYKELKKLDLKNAPDHVAIILDGNGRWAKSRGLSRSDGHKAGGETLDKLLDFFIELNVSVVSLYAFSTENWKRPKTEIKAIWKLLNQFFTTRAQRAMEKGICIRASGDLEGLPFRSRRIIKKVIKDTQHNDQLIANFCVNYGSRDEIIKAATKIAIERVDLWQSGNKKISKKPVTLTEFENHLYTSGLPDVDLLVRPGGESRISNFLLWQCAYAEIYITDTLWPDFTHKDIIKAVRWYQKRNRRFGGL